MKKLLVVILLFYSVITFSAPYNGQIMPFRQPDGSQVELKLFGDEFYIRAEGLDGYTVVRDKSSKWICYADLSSDGKELVSSGKHYISENSTVKSRPDGSLAMHIDIPLKQKLDIIAEKKKKILGDSNEKNDKTNYYPVSGNILGLCLVVDFSDEPGTLAMSEFENFCNNLTYSNFGNNGSLRTFYSDISGGIVNYENVVYGYYRAPHTFAYYEQLEYPTGAQQVLNLALNWLESNGFDFSTLSINPDGSIKAINLMYTGEAQTWSEGMWWHCGWYSGFTADGVHSGSYNCSPAYSPLSLATVCHENGHMIGNWPDTYKYSSNTGPDGIGDFDLMCAMGSYTNPVPPNPHFWSNAGWGKVINITHLNGVINDTANSLTCYKYQNVNDTNEFFLLENRIQSGRSQYLPDEGLTIWHIDRNGDNQTFHHEVFLEHANNNVYDHQYACYKNGFVNEFSSNSNPSSGYYNNDPSGLRVWEIGNTGNIMTYKIGAGIPAPSFILLDKGISGDNNANGYLEQDESFTITVEALNAGQIESDTATLYTSSIGVDSVYFTVLNPEEPMNTLEVDEGKEIQQIITIDENTPTGAQGNIQFVISDGTNSSTLTKQFIIGNQLLMSNDAVTTCGTLFFDDAGNNANYSDLVDYTMTFMPATEGKKIKVEFLSIGIEQETGCIYDYLRVYDGPTTSSRVFGKFCGVNTPSDLVSTHETGALTFVFHSDEYVNDIGWSAIISCSEPTAIETGTEKVNFGIFPNPLTEISFIDFIPGNDISIIITDVCGKPVKVFEGVDNAELKRTEFNEGVYIVHLVKNSQIIATQKLVVL